MPFMFDLFVSRWLDYNSPHEAGAIRQIYSDCESISIDYAILEKAKNVYVIPAGFNWNDLGLSLIHILNALVMLRFCFSNSVLN